MSDKRFSLCPVYRSIIEIDRNYFAISSIILPRLLPNSWELAILVGQREGQKNKRTKTDELPPRHYRCEKDGTLKITTHAPLLPWLQISFEQGPGSLVLPNEGGLFFSSLLIPSLREPLFIRHSYPSMGLPFFVLPSFSLSLFLSLSLSLSLSLARLLMLSLFCIFSVAPFEQDKMAQRVRSKCIITSSARYRNGNERIALNKLPGIIKTYTPPAFWQD
jgi:hypothetical protein